MNTDPHLATKTHTGDYLVRTPRATDALGHVLRGVFGDTRMPDDWTALLHRLDRVTH